MTQANDNFANTVQKAREQIESKEYLEAIENLDNIIQNDNDNAYALFLRGKAFTQLKKYKLALADLEQALNLYRQKDDKKFQVYILFELTFVYPFTGKVKEGFLAQQESDRIAKQLDLPEDDPLYSYVSHTSEMSDESLEQLQSELQNIKSIPGWDKFGLMGRLMGYATKGKWQSYLFFLVWLIVAIPGLIVAIVSFPIWLPKTIYQIKQVRQEIRNRNNEQ